MPFAKAAVLSPAGMDGGDGGWAVLRGEDALPANSGTIELSFDEDQLNDSERKHTTEQVAYFVIDPPLEIEPPVKADRMDLNGDSQVTASDALRVINRLGEYSVRISTSDLKEYDVNRDGAFSALDALVVINRLSRQSQEQSSFGVPVTSVPAVDQALSRFGEDDEDAWDRVITELL